MKALAAALAALAAHGAWLIAPWAEGDVTLPALALWTVALAACLAVGWAYRSPWALLCFAPTAWWLGAPGAQAGLGGAAALITLAAHLAASLAWLSGARAAEAGLEAPLAPGPAGEGARWRPLPATAASSSGLAAGPFGLVAAAAPLLAVAIALIDPATGAAADLGWVGAPARALAGLGALGVLAGLGFAGAAVAPRRRPRPDRRRAALRCVIAVGLLALAAVARG